MGRAEGSSISICGIGAKKDEILLCLQGKKRAKERAKRIAVDARVIEACV